MKLFKLIVLLFVLVIPAITHATDYYVNATTGNNSSGDGSQTSPWKTITHSLDQVTGTGHTINVAAGLYNTSLGETFPIEMNNGVSLIGAGKESTIIDAGGQNTVINCINLYDTNTLLEGFTIKNGGNVSQGGGIYIGVGSALTIRNNKIIENQLSTSSSSYGGAIYISNSSVKVLNNELSNNRAYYGGCIYISGFSPSIENNLIANNYVRYNGIIYMTNSMPQIVDNQIIENDSYNSNGSGIHIDNSSPTIKGNVLYDTGYNDLGQGINITGDQSYPRIKNNIISKQNRYGIYCGYNSVPTIINNTISENGLHGIYIYASAPDTIMNNIISYNGDYGICEATTSSDPENISYNIFYANELGLYYDEGNNVIYSAEKLNSDINGAIGNQYDIPMFVEKDNNDYHLQLGSPAIDAGNPVSNYSNEPSPNGGRINAGVYGNTEEATTSDQVSFPQGPDFYVSATSGSDISGDGSEGNPWKTITHSLGKIMDAGKTLHVAAGTYNPDLGENFPIYLKNGVSILGVGPDTSIIDANKTNTVFKCINVSDTTTLVKGFTITNGYNGKRGGGISITSNSALKVINNKIVENILYDDVADGGGIYISDSKPIIRNNEISNNRVDDDGGGIYINNSTVKILNNQIENNSSSSDGGGIYVLNSDDVIIHYNHINSNYGRNGGGGIGMYNSSALIIENDILESNGYSSSSSLELYNSSPIIKKNSIISTSAGYGIHISSENAFPKIYNNVIAKHNSSGIYCYYDSKSTITNNTISENGQHGIYLYSSSTPDSILNNIISFNSGYGIYEGGEACDPEMVEYNLFYGNSSGLYYDEGKTAYTTITVLNSSITEAAFNIYADPLFTDKTNNDYHLRPGSPGIDAGHPSSIYNFEPAPNGSRINVGAFGNTLEAATSEDVVFPEGPDFYVNASSGNNVTGDGTESKPWKTITYAFSQIRGTGKTIYVSSGTYNPDLGEDFPIYLKDGISLIGTGMDNTILDANSQSSVLKCINITDTSTTIKGFTIMNGRNSEQGGGIFIGSNSNVKIEENKICDNILYSDYANGGGIFIINSFPKIIKNIIKNNRADNAGGGIYAQNSDCIITDNEIMGNSSYDYGQGGGLCLIDSSNSFIYKNRVDSNYSYYGSGIYINNSNPTIENNQIVNNRSTSSASSRSSIYISSSSPIIINNSIISTNYSSGYGVYIYNENSHPRILYNVISKHELSGICFYNQSSGAIINNTISENGKHGIELYYNVYPDTIMNNIITYNSQYGISEYNENCDPGIVSFNLFFGNISGLYYDEGTTAYGTPVKLNSSVPECINNLFGDPLFVDRINNNYHLQDGSIAIDAGNPNSPLDPDGTRADIGALFYEQEPPELDYTILWPKDGETVEHTDSLVWLCNYEDALFNLEISSKRTFSDPEIAVDSLSATIPGDTTYFEVKLDQLLGNDALQKDEAYFWRIQPIHQGSTLGWSAGNTWFIYAGGPTSIKDNNNIPLTFKLLQNYPNPFNLHTTIRYSIPKKSYVSLKIFDIRGQIVSELINKEQNAGWHEIMWNGKNKYGIAVSTGVYFYKIQTHNDTDMKKMILVK